MVLTTLNLLTVVMKKTSYKCNPIPKDLKVIHLICVKEAFFNELRYTFKPGDITWATIDNYNGIGDVHPECNRHRGNYSKDCFKVFHNTPYKLKIYLL